MEKFKPIVWYNELGDILEVKWEEEGGFSEWVNPILTVTHPFDNSGKIIGLQIWGYKRNFIHSGIRLDAGYDESEELTEEDKEWFYSVLKKCFGVEQVKVQKELEEEKEIECKTDDIETLREDHKNWMRLISDIADALELKDTTIDTEDIVIKCPWCNGSGKDGHDRSVPPNSYICVLCNGSGRVEIVPHK